MKARGYFVSLSLVLLMEFLGQGLAQYQGNCNTKHTAAEGTIMSPGHPGKYVDYLACTTIITVEQGKHVQLEFRNFSLENHPTCYYDFVQILDGFTSKKYCGKAGPPLIRSRTNTLTVRFKTDYSVIDFGYFATYKTISLECDSYTVINNVSRSTSNIIDPASQLPLQDLLLPTGWYRFSSNAGRTIPNSCPASNSCGTTFPIWANGTMPKYIWDNVTMTACLRAYNDCCAYSWDIEVKKCSEDGKSFYIYNLPPADRGAYCAGSEKPCDPGLISPNGYTPGCRRPVDGCTTHTLIDDWKRSTSNIFDPEKQSPLSDHTWQTKWYRFKSLAGNEMPTSCPSLHSCGTNGSIWARGEMPQYAGNTTQMTACVRSGIDCCASNWSIKVKKCNQNGTSFYVYHLPRPTAPSMAYCAGRERPCEHGSISPNGFTPGCTKSFPSINGNPTIKPGIKNKRLEFICEFQSSDTDPDSIFEVTWYQGSRAEKIKLTHTLRGTERKASLQNSHEAPRDEDKIYFKLGTTIFCRVRSRFQNSNGFSSFKTSNKYFAGITVEPRESHFHITERDQKPLKLTVKATVPISCQTDPKCRITVVIKQDGTEDFFDGCILHFNQTGELTQEKKVEVSAKRDFSNRGDRVMHVTYEVTEVTDPIDWSDHKEIPRIKISIGDVKTARCYSTSDPNIYTFDRVYYQHFQVGDYVLAKSSCRKFEVHARTWACGRVSCNCGVAAQEGDDVIIIDMCRDGIPSARYASTVQPAIGTSIRRDRNGRKFEIKFPSGAFITYNVRGWGSWRWANIEVQVPSDDYYNCTSGLCGTFDSDRTNEFTAKDGVVHERSWWAQNYLAPDAFSESWRLPLGGSLFYHEGGEPRCREKAKDFCQCLTVNGKLSKNCRFANIADRPEYTRTGWIELEPPGVGNCGGRKRRSTSSDISLPNDSRAMSYVYNPTPLPRVTIRWPTASGKTQSQVTTYCTNKVKNSQPGLICKSIADFDFQPFISQCIEDVKISDDYAISSSSVMTMQGSCEEIFLKNVSYWQTDSTKNGSLGPPTAIGETLCPSLCNGNGRCVNATCICNSNYTSADCSINKNKGPTVTSIPLGGLCDVRKRSDCEKIRVNGRDFLDSEKLSCRSQHLKISEKPFEKLPQVDVTRGYMLSFAQTMCQLKSNPVKTAGDPTNTKSIPHAGYLLAISNNGKSFSSRSPMYLIYDSKCMNCSVTGTCIKKTDTCIINGYCFSQGELNPTDICLVCNTSLSTESFSIASSCNVAPPTTKGSDRLGSKDLIVIVCSTIGGIILIALVAITVIKYKKRRSILIKVKPAEKTENVPTFGPTYANPSYEGAAEEKSP